VAIASLAAPEAAAVARGEEGALLAEGPELWSWSTPSAARTWPASWPSKTPPPPACTTPWTYAYDLVRHYRYYDAEVADFDAVVRKTPPGGRALGLVFDRHSRVMRIESALVGLPHLYPAMRPAPGSMVPLHYCGMRHMPCRVLTPPKPLPAPSAWSPAGLQPEAAVDFFDYFFVRLPPHRPIFGEALNRLELIAQQGSWLVYRRKPGPPPGQLPSAAATPSKP
jgi:hypothetical protein